MLGRSSLFDQAAGEHDRLDERLDHEMATEFLHDDHGRQRPAAEAAGVLGERRGEQTQFGEGFPMLAAPAFFARHDLAPRVEAIQVAQLALDAGSQQFLLFRELDIHPLPPRGQARLWR